MNLGISKPAYHGYIGSSAFVDDFDIKKTEEKFHLHH